MSKEKYKVKLDVFEGPLDLLLYLIKRDEVDIQEITIERITTQYLEYINTFKLLNIDLASEFIVMAANLMFIKSRGLLPLHEQLVEEDPDEDDPRWELIRQLIEYKKFKEAANYLTDRATEQEDYFANRPDQPEFCEEIEIALPDSNVFDLVKAFQVILKRHEESHDSGDIVDDRFTVADKIEQLLQSLSPGERVKFNTLFSDATSKAEIIVTFLAVLELMKMNQFRVIQNGLLGEIDIERNSLHFNAIVQTKNPEN